MRMKWFDYRRTDRQRARTGMLFVASPARSVGRAHGHSAMQLASANALRRFQHVGCTGQAGQCSAVQCGAVRGGAGRGGAGPRCVLSCVPMAEGGRCIGHVLSEQQWPLWIVIGSNRFRSASSRDEGASSY